MVITVHTVKLGRDSPPVFAIVAVSDSHLEVWLNTDQAPSSGEGQQRGEGQQ